MHASDAVANAIAFLLLAAAGLLPIVGELYLQLRPWWRTRRNRRVATVINARCVECARPLDVVEPFHPTTAQFIRCPGCGVHLQVLRLERFWQICTVAEAKRQRMAPLPAVGPLRRAVRAVLAFLQPCEGIEPGESSLPGPEA